MRVGLKATLATKCNVAADKVTLVITFSAVRRRRHRSARRLANTGGVTVAYTVQVDSQAASDVAEAAVSAVAAGGDPAINTFIAKLKVNTPGGGFAGECERRCVWSRVRTC
jgi:hypothetical protein